MIVLSICLTVYNQIDLVKKNLDNLLKYKGEDVEFIVSDDCSDDEIEKLARSYKDDRLEYTRTPCNVGHDLNIINALEHAKGLYAIVLRSRDTLIIDKIPDITHSLITYKDISYAVFSAIDEKGKAKIVLSDKVYKEGKQTIYADKQLFVHPSGNIYKTSLLNLDCLKNHIEQSFSHKYGFVVHELIRMELACKGDFLTSSIITWIYPETNKQKDFAVNAVGQGKSVYSPELGYERYKSEFRYVNNVISTTSACLFLLNKLTMLKFFKRITYDFIRINKDKGMQRHYGYREIEYSFGKEKKRFIHCTNKMLEENRVPFKGRLRFFMYLYYLKLTFYYPIRDCLLRRLFNNEQRIKLAKIIKRF